VLVFSKQKKKEKKKRKGHFVAKISHDTSDLLARISTQNQL
jgi:hypothetical protein